MLPAAGTPCRGPVGRWRAAKVGVYGLLILASASTSAVAPARATPDDPPYPSPAWTAREAANHSRAHEEPRRQLRDQSFQARLAGQSATNASEQAAVVGAGRRAVANACASWAGPCAGDPFLYPGTDPFYDTEGLVTPVLFHDRTCGRLSGRVWAPRHGAAGDRRPAVVIATGAGLPETVHWWFAQELVRSGYVALTYDVRGHGRSDGSARGPGVDDRRAFVDSLVDAVDFVRSRPGSTGPSVRSCPGDPRTEAHNPMWARVDPERLGVVGHSRGAVAASVVQSFEIWPGASRGPNPVGVIVAWDNLQAPGPAPEVGGGTVRPRVPGLGMAGDYFIVPQRHTVPPDADAKSAGYAGWRSAGVPSYQVQVQAGTHQEWAHVPGLAATSWRSWGTPLATHYSLAWLDRWLKRSGEAGFDTADDRLLDDRRWTSRMSFYFRSARDFPDRRGRRHACADLRFGCG